MADSMAKRTILASVLAQHADKTIEQLTAQVYSMVDASVKAKTKQRTKILFEVQEILIDITGKLWKIENTLACLDSVTESKRERIKQ